MIDLYTASTPNGWKASVTLEELGLPYTVHALDLAQGEQKAPAYLRLNPNGRIPTIVDRAHGDFAVFESGAILLYLAEKTGKFLPENTPKARGELLSWLMFVASGVGPYAGQSVHFRNYAPEKLPYAINRYAFEAQRHFGILDEHLARRKYMLGDAYTIVDMD
ncbi:MAG: glutathione S-transferase N-terminal domain-containing protein, partial [Burkholderiales bacterium]|nr:glutathione S-transferase N-terminal domain-containing protein [Burkholderiales bacterium]